MANKRIDELTAASSVVLTDLAEICTDPSGAKLHRKATLQQLLNIFTPAIAFKTYDTIALFEAASDYTDRGVYLVFGDTAIGDGFSTLWRFSSSSTSALGPGVRKPNAINIADPGRYHQITL